MFDRSGARERRLPLRLRGLRDDGLVDGLIERARTCVARERAGADRVRRRGAARPPGAGAGVRPDVLLLDERANLESPKRRPGRIGRSRLAANRAHDRGSPTPVLPGAATGDRTGLLLAGQLVEIGPTEELMSRLAIPHEGVPERRDGLLRHELTHTGSGVLSKLDDGQTQRHAGRRVRPHERDPGRPPGRHGRPAVAGARVASRASRRCPPRVAPTRLGAPLSDSVSPRARPAQVGKGRHAEQSRDGRAPRHRIGQPTPYSAPANTVAAPAASSTPTRLPPPPPSDPDA